LFFAGGLVIKGDEQSEEKKDCPRGDLKGKGEVLRQSWGGRLLETWGGGKKHWGKTGCFIEVGPRKRKKQLVAGDKG